MNTLYKLVTAALGGAMFFATAWAHHSAAGVDMSVTKTASGTLKEMDWAAPHAAVVVIYKNDAGEMEEVYLGTAAPALITRQGFKRQDFRPGSKVEVSWHPNRAGQGGELESLKLEDGRVLTGGIAPPGAPGVGKPGLPSADGAATTPPKP